MAIYHIKPPVRGGERSRLPSAQRGPVSLAIAIMQAADPDRERIRDLRCRVAERIEADIALLDALDGDCDLEEDDPAGGDICDEPHDPEEDAGAEENHSAAFLCEFNGYSYAPVIGRRRA